VLELPDFPWDTIAAETARARSHPDGFVDLSVGSPVDPTPQVVLEALATAGDAHGYPTTIGTPALREAMIDWWHRRRGAAGLTVDDVIPSIGSKEFIALLPLALGLGPGDIVVHPELAYPTYEVGAVAVGATPLAADDPADWPAGTRLIWLNSPGNPDGRVLDAAALRAAIARARELGAVIVSDECYAELNWAADEPTPSILDADVLGERRDDVLAISSLSKQSNLAGYRAALVAGDRARIRQIVQVRKHLGLMTPSPVQTAMTAALGDDAHVAAQRAVYLERRRILSRALLNAGFVIDESTAGLYLWTSRGEPARETLAFLADLGILVAPGDFYGPRGARHVRVALTASDADIREAAARLALLA